MAFGQERRRWFGRITTRNKAVRQRAKQLHFEELERFVLLSTFTVTNTNSSGIGSFAQAVADANTAGGGQIDFSIGGGGPQTIPTSGVNITAPIFINGASQPNPTSAAYPLIELQGTGDQSGVGVLLNTGSNGSIVSGLFVSNFFLGIEIVSAGNTIGGTTPTARNVLSDNDRGIEIIGAAATGNVVEGNYLGTDRNGSTALANGFGIVVDSAASNNRIGGTAPGARNVISGNYYGVCLSSVGATGNVVEGNYIGTDSAGTTAVANTVIGVLLQYGASNNLIGGTTAGSGNVISGNGNNVYIAAAGTTGNQVVGNLIGLTADGTSVVETGPSYVGIYIGEAASGNTVGGTTAAARNVIAGPMHGVQLNGTGVVNNIVQGNYIGTDITGINALGTGIGVLIHGGASNNAIGGTAFGAGNLISGNGFGVNITDVGSSNNTLEGNFIGTDVTGTLPLPNEYIGVQIQNGATGNIVGGTTTGSRNLISGNGTRVVQLYGAGTTGNLVAGNFIGVDVTGTRLLANSDIGIVISAGAFGNTIGGTTASARNVINGSNCGVEVYGVGADNNVVQGNYIGSDVSGTLALGNTCGVLIGGGAQNNLLGGTTTGARNLITGNGDYAVILTVSGTTGNAVQGNFIGTDLTGAARLGTLQYGVVVGQGASNNTIGGTAAGAGNVIAFTANSAVLIGVNTNDLTIGNAVLGNSIFQAGFLGIDHANDGLTSNTPGGPHSGPNQLQNKPILTSAKSTSTTTLVAGTLDSTPNATLRIEFFANPAPSFLGNGQGKTYLGFANVTTDANGLASFQVSLPASTGVISATATDANGNTSEFAQSLPVKLVPQQPSLRSAILKWDGTVTLTWDDVAGETGYRVERSANDNGVWTVVGTVGAGATTLTDSGPITAPLYAYRLFATNTDGDSEASVPLRVSTTNPAPLNLTATPAGNDRINLAWTDIASDEQGFKIERSTDGVSFTQIGTIATPNETAFSATGLAAGTTYLFRVRAYKGNENSAFSNIATATTTAAIPSPPTGLTLSSTSPGWINLSWRANSDNEQGFKIERSADGVTFIQVGTTGAGATYYNDVTSDPGGTYFYRVRAYNGAGDSSFTETVGGSSLLFNTMLVLLPATSISSTQLELRWRDFQNNETGFEVERSTDGVIFDKIATAPGGFFNDGSYLSYTVTGLSAGTTYLFRVRATNDQGKSGYSNTITARTSSVPPAVPAAPLSVNAVPTSSTQIYLTWIDNADNEQGYRIQRSTDGVNFTPPITVLQDSTDYYDNNLSPATTYYYRIRAYNAAGESNNTDPVSATTINLNAPTSLSATVLSSSRIELSWGDPSTNETGFKVERSTDGVTFTDVEIAPAANPSPGVPVKYQVAGLSAGTTYYFRVRAYNGAGDSAFSKVVMARTSTAPAAPTNLTATPAGNERVNLAWTDNAINEQGFKVDWSTDGVNFTPKATLLGPNQTSYSVTGLAPGTAYSFRVRAYNGDDSPYSNTATAQTTSRPPAAPTGLTATVPSNIQINLVWLAASDDAAGYHVERSTDGINFIPVPSVTGPSTSVTGLSPATTYTFRVRAYNAAGESVGFAAVVATTAAYPITPTGVTAAAISGSVIRLSWQDASNETGYRIERSGPSGWSLVGTVGADITTFTDTGLSEVTNYQYRILAYNAAGNSPYSGTIFATTSVTAPANATATFRSVNRIEITWTDRSAVESKYFVELSLDGSTGWTEVGNLNANTTSLTVNGPFNPSTTYYFRIRAIGIFGYSIESATASVTTPAFPLAPTGVAVAPAADGGLTVTWSDVADETGYRVERSPNGSNGWTSATVGAGVTSFTDSGLAENTRYYYRVFASNAAGESVPSVTATALTLLATPGNLTVTYVSPTQIDVTWADRSALESIYAIEQWFDSLNRWQQVGTTDANATSYSFTGSFQPSTAYTFRVRATSNSTLTSSPFTTPVTVTTPAFPLAPTGVSAVGSSESAITLTWTDRADETGYKIERMGPTGWSQVGTVEANVTTFVDGDLSEATNYQYRIVAYNGAGNSPYSGSASATTLLTAPANLSATLVNPTRIDVVWVDLSAREENYLVEWARDGSTIWTIGGQLNANTTSLSINGSFTATTTYHIRVRAGAIGYSSNYSTVSLTTPAFPSAPTGLNATATSDTSINLSWSATANAEGYRVERIADNLIWTLLATVEPGVTSFLDTGLREATSYSYRIVATNAFANSPPSATRSAFTTPAAPTGLAANSTSGSRIDLSWTNRSSVMTTIYIEQSADGTNWHPITPTGVSGTAYSVLGSFSGSTLYSFRIRAYNSSYGYSGYATTTFVTPGFPSVPTGVTALPASPTSIAVSWSDVANETGYRVERLSGTGVWTTIGSVDAGVTTLTDTGLAASVTYSYRIVASNAAGASAYSTTVSARIDLTQLPPVTANDAYTVGHDQTLSVNSNGVLRNDSDPNGRTLTAALVTGVQHGTIILNPNGTFIYVPAAGYFGVDSFTYRVSNAIQLSNTATVTINVAESAPVAVNDAYDVGHDRTLLTYFNGVLRNDTDPDGDHLTATLVTEVQHGTLTFNPNGTFTYVPDAGYFGSDSFTYRVSDGLLPGNTATATIVVTQSAPVAADDAFTISHDRTLTAVGDFGSDTPSLQANDGDADGDAMTSTLVTNVQHGTLALNPDGSFTYIPTAGFSGTDSFTYRNSDGLQISGVATVSIAVTSSAPVAANDSYTVGWDRALNASGDFYFGPSSLLANDTDADGDTLSVTLVTDVQHGSLTLNGDGSFLYVPDTGYTGPDGFTYRASDGTLFSDVATVSITVSVDSFSTVQAGSISVGQDTLFTGTVATFTTSNPTLQASDFTASIAWGDGTVTSGTVVDGGTAGSFAITGTHKYSAAGTYAVSVKVTAVDGSSVTINGQAAIAVGNLSIGSFNAIAFTSVSGVEGEELSGTVATFGSSNSSLQAASFVAWIDWGDGTVTTGGVSGAGGSFLVTATHVYTVAGTYSVTVEVDAADGNYAIVDGAAVIGDAAIGTDVETIEATAGQSFSGRVATFMDDNLYSQAWDFTATIDWGDGVETTGFVEVNGDGDFEVKGTHVYTASGNFSITVRVDEVGVRSITAMGSAAVAAADLIATGEAIETKTGQEFSGVIAILDDANPYSSASDFTAEIDWGDGSATTEGTILPVAAAEYYVSGKHKYTGEGTFTITITLTNVDGVSTTATGSASVEPSDSGESGSVTQVSVTPKTYTGHVAATVVSFATAAATVTSSSLSISGLPAGVTIENATLYADNYNHVAQAHPTLVFAGTPFGAPSESSTNGQASNFGWDVTNLVSGNGIYSVSLSGMTYNQGATLVVVYSAPDLPLRTVLVHGGAADLHPVSGPVTFNQIYSDMLGGTVDLWIRTGADNLAGETGEKIKLNGEEIAGPIDANLGFAASLFHLTNLSTVSGENTLSISSPRDWFNWTLTVFVTSAISLSIDSDNNNGFSLPDGSRAEEKANSDLSQPGKILTVDSGDGNGNGIPDFADGYVLNGSMPVSDDDRTPDLRFVPIVLKVPSDIDPQTEIEFAYDGSNPAGVVMSTDGLGTVYTPAPGQLRLWTKDGSEVRIAADFLDGGDYITPSRRYSLADLGLGGGNDEITLWLESVRPSISLGDGKISVILITNDGAGERSTVTSTVRTSSIETRIVRVNPDGTPSNQSNIQISSPAPVFSDVSITIDPNSLHASPDGSVLLGDILISGNLTDAALNLVPGVEGTIGYVSIFVNGSKYPVTVINTNVTKGSNPSSLLKPYEFSATFTATLSGIVLEEGWNSIHLSASDVYGYSGFAGTSIEVLMLPISESADELSTNYSGFTFEVGSSSGVIASSPGDFNPFVVKVVGPAELLDMMQDVTIGGQTYKLAGGGDDERFLASQNAPATPRAFMAAPSPKLSAPSPAPAPAPWSQSRTLDFVQGFGAGLLDTGVDWWDGIKSVAKTGWHVIKNYNPFVVYYKLAVGESTVVAEDQQAAYAAWDTVEAIAKIAGQIINDEGNLLYEALGGNVEAINRLGEQYTLTFEIVAELLSSIKNEILNMSAHDGGRVVGRIVGETLVTVAATLATAGVGAIVKSTTIPAVITKLKSAATIPAAVINKLETTAIKLVTALARTKMCFVAGTPIHTKSGLVAIEEIRPGDLVLSRDPETGEQGYKPVVETFVTQPSQLLHVHYQGSDGRSGVLTGTREHPFFVAAAGRFVPAGELSIGDVLSMADGAEVAVSALFEETAELDRPFTTYNFAVAVYHTYFAGEGGVWVHNNGEGLCQRIFSLYNGVKLKYGLEDQPWEAFKILLNKTSKARWWINAAFGDTVDEVMRAVYKQAVDPLTGTVNLSAVPKVKEVYQAIGAVWNPSVFGGKGGWVGSRFGRGLGDYGLQVHHTSVTGWAEVLLKRPLTQAEKDDMPALLLRKVDHVGKKGSGAFHAILSASMPYNSTTDKATVLLELEQAYDEFGQPEVWAVARQWLKDMGVQ